MKFFKISKDMCIKVNNKLNELWQSKNEDYKNIVRNTVVFIFLVTFLEFIRLSYADGLNTIVAIIVCYFEILFSFVFIVGILTYFYIFGKKKYEEFWIRLFRCTYKLILLLLIILLSPCIVILFFTTYIIKFRAKNTDNIMYALFFTIVLFIILKFLLQYNILLIVTLLKYIDNVSVIRSIEYNHNFLIIFLFILISMIEINIFTYSLLKIINKYRLNKIKKSNPNLSDIVYEEKDINYDLNYFRKTIWRYELFGLILCFIIATVTENIFLGVGTEVKDATTVITLGMLYWDKRKEWK